MTQNTDLPTNDRQPDHFFPDWQVAHSLKMAQEAIEVEAREKQFALEEVLDSLEDAREGLRIAIESLRAVQRSVPTLSSRIDAYLISTLEQAISKDNQWLGGANSCNLADLEQEVIDYFLAE